MLRSWLTVCLFAFSLMLCRQTAAANPDTLLQEMEALSQRHQGSEGPISCLIEPSLQAAMGTQVEGVLEKVMVDRGDFIRRGQLLAQLSVGVEKAAVAYQEVRVAYGTRRVDRNKALKRQKLISPQDLDEIVTELELSQLELQERKEQLKLRQIYAPFDGVVVDRMRDPGDMIKQELIMNVARIDPLHVELVVPATQLNRFKKGEKRFIEVPLLKKRFEARVSVIDKVVDAASGTFRVRLVLPNKRHRLSAGLRCKLTR
ncbi:efflux RND transporter periplasmic adaptor subunit [Magnetococcus sp. PR-3]|uniref:efflux RND transporter periplasmic adaptor subunit n=1 Tax=Magnetococcus sp. PR-3 TaxID=3120355 RepID=UPI002FCE53D4